MGIVVWREWFNEAAIKQLTKMGTLPRNEEDIDGAENMDGDEVAEIIAERANVAQHDNFAHGGCIVIVEPAVLSGTYDIETEYEPRFIASLRDPDEKSP